MYQTEINTQKKSNVEVLSRHLLFLQQQSLCVFIDESQCSKLVFPSCACKVYNHVNDWKQECACMIVYVWRAWHIQCSLSGMMVKLVKNRNILLCVTVHADMYNCYRLFLITVTFVAVLWRSGRDGKRESLLQSFPRKHITSRLYPLMEAERTHYISMRTWTWKE